jgi:hypothetical protein
MKKIENVMKVGLPALLILVLVACISPTSRFNSKQAKVDKTKEKIQANQAGQQAIGRDFVYAADQALSQDPTPSRETEVAADMTHRALLALGLPEAEQASQLRQMVCDLISTNEELVVKGKRALAEKDAALAKIQAEKHSLDDKLGAAEAKLRLVSLENAELASKWVRLRRIAEWLVGGIVFLILLILAIHILPLIFPELSGAQLALRSVISAVQHIRDTLETSHPEAAKTVNGALSVAIPPNSKQSAVIDKIKASLGL